MISKLILLSISHISLKKRQRAIIDILCPILVEYFILDVHKEIDKVFFILPRY